MTEPLLIPCPKCGRELKLRDPKLLGRTGKCPNCRHRFRLEKPDDVELELVDSTIGGSGKSGAPAVGTSPRWVPDDAPAANEETPPDQEPPAVTDDAPPGAATPASGNGHGAPAAAEFPGIGETDSGGLAELKYLRQSRTRRARIAIAVSVVTAIGAALTTWLVMSIARDNEEERPKIDQAYEAEKRLLQDNLSTIKAASPTNGDPIELLYLPAGVHLIVNVHPAALWQEGSLGEEVRFGLGEGINSWAEQSIRQICLFEPAEIEEALICKSLGAPGGPPPETSAVVRLVDEHEKSDFLLRFRAERDDSFAWPVYRNDERAYIIIDRKTFAVGPRAAAGEMVDGMKLPNRTDQDIEEVLRYTDDDRHLTVVFKPLDLRNFQDELVAEDVRNLLNLFVDWLIEDVAAVAWSVHLGRETFHSEMILRNTRATSPRQLRRQLRERLDRLPEQVLRMVEKMDPQKAGHRMIIGRFPAMVYAVSESTLGGVATDSQYVNLTTRLPERAGPNLSTALFLTWLESLRTDFSKEAPQTTAPQLPQLLADRLKRRIEIDFRRMPLYGAFDYIGAETKVKFDIDGEALKAKGMTQNMAQNQKLGVVAATKAIQAIIDQYKDEGMCVVVDEKAKLATVTTLTAVEQKGIEESPTVHVFAPAK